MSLFNQITLLTPFICKFCGKSQWEENGSVPVCGCPQSQAAEITSREAAKALAKQRQALEPSFFEIRMMRKLRSRKLP